MTKIVRDVPQGLALAAQSPEFWRRLAPCLTVSEKPRTSKKAKSANIRADRMRLTGEGFLHLSQPELSDRIDAIAEGMERLVLAGLPVAFIAVYDEVWDLVSAMRPGLDDLVGGKAAMVPDLWATFAQPGHDGTRAERKRGGTALNGDRTPKTISVWMGFNEATPESGCMHVVPASADKNYGATRPGKADAALQTIRALPTKAGDVLIWTGETYAWRSRTSKYSEAEPQMSLTLEFQDASSAPVDGYCIGNFTELGFEERLGLVAEQMLKHGKDYMERPSWRVVVQSLLNRYRNAEALESA